MPDRVSDARRAHAGGGDRFPHSFPRHPCDANDSNFDYEDACIHDAYRRIWDVIAAVSGTGHTIDRNDEVAEQGGGDNGGQEAGLQPGFPPASMTRDAAGSQSPGPSPQWPRHRGTGPHPRHTSPP